MNTSRLFVETAEGPALAGLACKVCGKVSFPIRAHCPHCLAEEGTEVRPLSRRGRLFSFTTAEVGVPTIQAPYSFGFVDLPEGMRVFSLLDPAGELREGMMLELVVPEGKQGYRFVAVRQ